MAELTPEEKQRIYEEEKTRLEAQVQIKKKLEKKKTSSITWGCLTLVIIIAIVWFIGIFSPSKRSEAPPPPVQKKEEVELKATVRFTGTQFIIVNKNNFAWTNVKLDINPGTFKSGYVYKVSKISSNKEYTVGAMQFAKGDGTRFNPFTMKPKEIFIACDTPKGRGYYTGGWE